MTSTSSLKLNHQVKASYAAMLLVGVLFSASASASLFPPIVDYTGEGNPIIGAQVVVATTGDVKATYLSGSGFYTDYLYLDYPGHANQNTNPNSIGSNWIFVNHGSTAGDTIDLGSFTAGTVLKFNVLADTSGAPVNQGLGPFLNWYTGPASLNADGLAHAWVDSAYTGLYGGTAVGFEDLSGLGDAGYEDLRYTFSNVQAVSVPEPATITLMVLGLAGIGFGTRRKLF
jgi:xanthosine utilization system XapX-like protein